MCAEPTSEPPPDGNKCARGSRGVTRRGRIAGKITESEAIQDNSTLGAFTVSSFAAQSACQERTVSTGQGAPQTTR